MSSSLSTTRIVSSPLRPSRSAWKSASSATRSSNAAPHTLSTLTPPRGIHTSVLPFGGLASLSFLAMILPSCAHSSGLVRMSDTQGLCAYSLLPCSFHFSGTVSIGPKFTISSAPSDTTCGTPLRAAASSRCGPAVRTPPTSSSASSVVVRSRTPSKNPAEVRRSSARPPAPDAWKTYGVQSYLARSVRACVTAGVVTPNIVIAIRLPLSRPAATSTTPAPGARAGVWRTRA
ncbi:hypothetical protein GSI_11628 [Ganoderma sinense ZZ0214-1]|uniref:Uncharacterized protein n=1 Tax=Ganoderma sinense ZZ0214-1 TaxID=1077348 RepID=A0A2G8RWH8_9APHY|nr:hypothetical protein GSI_11628 [Ganoderma sinense ZZ0214-1]